MNTIADEQGQPAAAPPPLIPHYHRTSAATVRRRRESRSRPSEVERAAALRTLFGNMTLECEPIVIHRDEGAQHTARPTVTTTASLLLHSAHPMRELGSSLLSSALQHSFVRSGLAYATPLVQRAQPVLQRAQPVFHTLQKYGDPVLDRVDERLSSTLKSLPFLSTMADTQWLFLVDRDRDGAISLSDLALTGQATGQLVVGAVQSVATTAWQGVLQRTQYAVDYVLPEVNHATATDEATDTTTTNGATTMTTMTSTPTRTPSTSLTVSSVHAHLRARLWQHVRAHYGTAKHISATVVAPHLHVDLLAIGESLVVQHAAHAATHAAHTAAQAHRAMRAEWNAICDSLLHAADSIASAALGSSLTLADRAGVVYAVEQVRARSVDLSASLTRVIGVSPRAAAQWSEWKAALAAVGTQSTTTLLHEPLTALPSEAMHVLVVTLPRVLRGGSGGGGGKDTVQPAEDGEGNDDDEVVRKLDALVRATKELVRACVPSLGKVASSSEEEDESTIGAQREDAQLVTSSAVEEEDKQEVVSPPASNGHGEGESDVQEQHVEQSAPSSPPSSNGHVREADHWTNGSNSATSSPATSSGSVSPITSVVPATAAQLVSSVAPIAQQQRSSPSTSTVKSQGSPQQQHQQQSQSQQSQKQHAHSRRKKGGRGKEYDML